MAEQQPTADSPAEFRIFARTLTGQNLAVQVSLDDTVQDFQVKLSAQDPSLGPEMAKVIYNQQYMQRDLTLRYYKIKPDHTVFCVRRCKYRVAGRRWERICLEVGEDLSGGGRGVAGADRVSSEEWTWPGPQAGGMRQGGCSRVCTRELQEHACTASWEEGRRERKHFAPGS